MPGTKETYKKMDTFLDNLANAATAAATANTAAVDNSGMAKLMEANKQLVAAVAALTMKVNGVVHAWVDRKPLICDISQNSTVAVCRIL